MVIGAPSGILLTFSRRTNVETRKLFLTDLDGSLKERKAAFYATINDAILSLAEDYRLETHDACVLVKVFVERNDFGPDGDEEAVLDRNGGD